MAGNQGSLHSRGGSRGGRPSAIVLCKAVTGLATIRALAQAGVDVHAVILAADDPVRFSRCCTKLHLYGKEKDDPALLDFLRRYSKQLGNRPAVFPCSDALALFLARNYAELEPTCHIWTTRYDDLVNIIGKDGLYAGAAAAGIPTVPFIVAPGLDQITEWSRANPAPYLLKPFYTGIATSPIHGKNIRLATRDELLSHVAKHGADSLIIQRLLRGGDGYIFDCYGLCGRDGRALTMASHRRWRQSPPDFGATCLGEIPAGIGASVEQAIYQNTARLLASVRYHGIFGIEWLMEKETGNLYLIDFNARPFTTIGHLKESGLNLPALAYQELIGEVPAAIEPTPALKRLLWVELASDMETFARKHETGELGFAEWLVSLFRCDRLAYWDWRDPGPGVYRLLTIIARLVRFAIKKALGQATVWR